MMMIEVALCAGCAVGHKAARPAAAATEATTTRAAGSPSAMVAATAAAAPAATAAAPARLSCRVARRQVSAAGREGATPDVVAVGDAFAVAWEEGGEHRGVRV